VAENSEEMSEWMTALKFISSPTSPSTLRSNSVSRNNANDTNNLQRARSGTAPTNNISPPRHSAPPPYQHKPLPPPPPPYQNNNTQRSPPHYPPPGPNTNNANIPNAPAATGVVSYSQFFANGLKDSYYPKQDKPRLSVNNKAMSSESVVRQRANTSNHNLNIKPVMPPLPPLPTQHQQQQQQPQIPRVHQVPSKPIPPNPQQLASTYYADLFKVQVPTFDIESNLNSQKVLEILI
jgi:hypothetical protein